MRRVSMDTTTTQIDQSQQVRQRALRRTIGERRRRIVRSVAVFVLVTAAIVVLVMARRDQEALAKSKRVFEFIQRSFQDKFVTAALPALLPMPTDETRDATLAMRDSICYAPAAKYQREPNRPQVAVCYHYKPLRLFLRPAGRHVVLFDGHDYSLVWMAETEVQQRAAELGIYLGPKP